MSLNSNNYVRSSQLLPNANPQTAIGRILLFPLTRIIIAVLFLLPATLFHILFEKSILPHIPENFKTISTGAESIIGLALFILLYCLYTRLIEKRPARELGRRHLFKELVPGFALGGGLIAVAVATLAIFGYYGIHGFSDDKWVLLTGTISLVLAAFVEELIFRVVLFRLSEEFLGSWMALIANILFFGFAHSWNPNATPWTSLAIGIEAGVLLSAAFMLTRKIWFPFALHFGWNYFQAKIFGITTSGTTVSGIIIPAIDGPELMTGGTFGIEGSIIAVLLCLVAGILLLKATVNQGQIVRPLWIRRKMIGATD